MAVGLKIDFERLTIAPLDPNADPNFLLQQEFNVTRHRFTVEEVVRVSINRTVRERYSFSILSPSTTVASNESVNNSMQTCRHAISR